MFNETQRFTQWWLWLILIGVWASMVYSIVTAPSQTDAAAYVSFGIGILLPLLFWQMKLTTRITQEGIYVRFFPFHFKIRQHSQEQVCMRGQGIFLKCRVVFELCQNFFRNRRVFLPDGCLRFYHQRPLPDDCIITS